MEAALLCVNRWPDGQPEGFEETNRRFLRLCSRAKHWRHARHGDIFVLLRITGIILERVQQIELQHCQNVVIL
jgi:hypothetical protein